MASCGVTHCLHTEQKSKKIQVWDLPFPRLVVAEAELQRKTSLQCFAVQDPWTVLDLIFALVH